MKKVILFLVCLMPVLGFGQTTQVIRQPSGNGSGTPGPAGQGFNFRGAWKSNTSYLSYDVFTFNGQTYEVSSPFVSGSTFDATKANLWAVQGGVGPQGPAGPAGPQGPAGNATDPGLTGDATKAPGSAATTVVGVNGITLSTLGSGLYYFTNGVPRLAKFSDVLAFWTNCTSGYLKFDGTCATPPGSNSGGVQTGTSYNWTAFQTFSAGLNANTGGATLFSVNQGVVSTSNNTLDDGAGNVVIRGTETIGGTGQSLIDLKPGPTPTVLPAAGSQRLYIDSLDSNRVKLIDSAGVITPVTSVRGLENVAYASTVNFSVSTKVSRLFLTGDATFVLPAGTSGQDKTLIFVQDSAGNHTVTPPSNVRGFLSMGFTPNKIMSQHYVYSDLDSAWIADGPGAKNE